MSVVTRSLTGDDVARLPAAHAAARPAASGDRGPCAPEPAVAAPESWSCRT